MSSGKTALPLIYGTTYAIAVNLNADWNWFWWTNTVYTWPLTLTSTSLGVDKRAYVQFHPAGSSSNKHLGDPVNLQDTVSLFFVNSPYQVSDYLRGTGHAAPTFNAVSVLPDPSWGNQVLLSVTSTTKQSGFVREGDIIQFDEVATGTGLGAGPSDPPSICLGYSWPDAPTNHAQFQVYNQQGTIDYGGCSDSQPCVAPMVCQSGQCVSPTKKSYTVYILGALASVAFVGVLYYYFKIRPKHSSDSSLAALESIGSQLNKS